MFTTVNATLLLSFHSASPVSPDNPKEGAAIQRMSSQDDDTCAAGPAKLLPGTHQAALHGVRDMSFHTRSAEAGW